MEYNIERISPKHFEDMLSLFEHSFYRKLHPDFFNRKFDTSKLGPELLGYVAYTKEGILAASYGLYPCKIIYNGKSYPAAISGDSMTHSDHRGKGLFDKLARMTYELAKNSGIKFMYCFPNQYTYTGSIKLGWHYADEKMFTYSINVPTLPIAKIARKNNLTNNIYKSYVNLIFKLYKSDLSSFKNSILENNIGGVLHDEDFVSYKRYSQNAIIKINTTNVWIKVDGELKIGDIENCNEEGYKKVIKKLKFFSFLLGCTEIQTTVSDASPFHKAMHSHFKNEPSFMVGRIEYGIDFPKENVKFTMSDFDTF